MRITAQSVANCKKCFTCLNELRCRKISSTALSSEEVFKANACAVTVITIVAVYLIAVAIQNGVIRAEVNIKVLHIHHISELIRRMNGVNVVCSFIINPAIVITNHATKFINLIMCVDITQLETFPQRSIPIPSRYTSPFHIRHRSFPLHRNSEGPLCCHKDGGRIVSRQN